MHAVGCSSYPEYFIVNIRCPVHCLCARSLYKVSVIGLCPRLASKWAIGEGDKWSPETQFTHETQFAHS